MATWKSDTSGKKFLSHLRSAVKSKNNQQARRRSEAGDDESDKVPNNWCIRGNIWLYRRLWSVFYRVQAEAAVYAVEMLRRLNNRHYHSPNFKHKGSLASGKHLARDLLLANCDYLFCWLIFHLGDFERPRCATRPPKQRQRKNFHFLLQPRKAFCCWFNIYLHQQFSCYKY